MCVFEWHQLHKNRFYKSAIFPSRSVSLVDSAAVGHVPSKRTKHRPSCVGFGHTLPPPSIGSARSFLTRERGSKTPTSGRTVRGTAGIRLGNHEPDLRGNVLGGGGGGGSGG